MWKNCRPPQSLYMHPLPKFFASRFPLEIPTKSVKYWKKPHENTALPFHGNFLKLLAALL
jgi:hypothetical protein